MRSILILLLIAVCAQEILGSRRVQRYTSPSGAIAKKNPQKAQPISEEKTTLDDAPESSSTSKTTALNEIPIISSKKIMVIEGENGKISADGVLLYKDEKFNGGAVRLKVTNEGVFINGNLVAKNPQDGTVAISDPDKDDRDISKFRIEIKNAGRTTSYSKNGWPASVWNMWV